MIFGQNLEVVRHFVFYFIFENSSRGGGGPGGSYAVNFFETLAPDPEPPDLFKGGRQFLSRMRCEQTSCF